MINKYAHLGGLAGLALVLLGLIIYSINSVFTVVTNVLIIVGAILLIAFIVLKFKTIKQGMTSRSAKFGSNAALLIIFVFGIIIIVNVLLSRFSYRVDTTSAKIYSLAEQTTKVLRNLDNDVKVIGFFKTGSAQQIEELLLEYSNVSSRFKYELVDPDKKPGLAKRYGIKAYGTLVVESNGKEEKIEKSSEEEITNSLNFCNQRWY